MEEQEKGIVCVTGGAGYMASWLIMRLLQHGYTVHTTIRSDPKFKEDVGHLKILPESSKKLKIFDADLDKPESFQSVINGCEGVFLVAHPMDIHQKFPMETVIKTATEGTLGILKACLNSKTVKKVVYTSSIAAATCTSNMDLKEIDENTWTDVELCRNTKSQGVSYAISKTLTERAALEFASKYGLDLVTLLPAMVVGPFITPNLPISLSLALALVWGDVELYKLIIKTNMVHIDDIASAQILLLECPNTEGRYICSAIDTTIHELAKFLSINYPEFQMPVDLLSTMEEEKPTHLSSRKLLDLGFNFKYGLQEMLDGAIQCCKEKGFL